MRKLLISAAEMTQLSLSIAQHFAGDHNFFFHFCNLFLKCVTTTRHSIDVSRYGRLENQNIVEISVNFCTKFEKMDLLFLPHPRLQT